MIANCDGKDVRVYETDGRLVRTFHCRSEAVSAYVSGDQVNIQLANGHGEIWRIDGLSIRRF